MNNPLDSVTFDINDLRANDAFNWECVEGIDAVSGDIINTCKQVVKSIGSGLEKIGTTIDNIDNQAVAAIQQTAFPILQDISDVDTSIKTDIQTSLQPSIQQFGLPIQDARFYLVAVPIGDGRVQLAIQKAYGIPSLGTYLGPYEDGCLLSKAARVIFSPFPAMASDYETFEPFRAQLETVMVQIKDREDKGWERYEPFAKYDCVALEDLPPEENTDLSTVSPVVSDLPPPLEDCTGTNPHLNKIIDVDLLHGTETDFLNQKWCRGTVGPYNVITQFYQEGTEVRLSDNNKYLYEREFAALSDKHDPFIPPWDNWCCPDIRPPSQEQIPTQIPEEPTEEQTPLVYQTQTQEIDYSDCCRAIVEAVDRLTAAIEGNGGMTKSEATSLPSTKIANDIEYFLSGEGESYAEQFITRENIVIPENPDDRNMGDLILRFASSLIIDQSDTLTGE